MLTLSALKQVSQLLQRIFRTDVRLTFRMFTIHVSVAKFGLRGISRKIMAVIFVGIAMLLLKSIFHPVQKITQLLTKNPKLTPIIKDLVNHFPQQCPAFELCISFGTPVFGDWKSWPLYSGKWKNVCSKKFNCTLVSDQSQAHALIFHSRDLSPAKRTFHNYEQHQIYFSWEPPTYVQQIGYNIFEDSYWRKQFNLTATYDRDADIVVPYAWLEPLTKQEMNEINKQPLYDAGKKKKMAYGVISNCNTPSKREEYLKELTKYIDVDIYGHCGKKILPPVGAMSRDMVIGSLSGEYRFYLSFENSICKDYITEKFWWNGMKYPIIPVVLGGENRLDYEQVAPRNSFIHVNDFQNVSALAKHLKLVSENETLYSTYLEWKRQWKVTRVDKGEDLICKVCEYLHSEKALQRKTIDIAEVWSSKRKCFN